MVSVIIMIGLYNQNCVLVYLCKKKTCKDSKIKNILNCCKQISIFKNRREFVVAFLLS